MQHSGQIKEPTKQATKKIYIKKKTEFNCPHNNKNNLEQFIKVFLVYGISALLINFDFLALFLACTLYNWHPPGSLGGICPLRDTKKFD